MKLAALVLTLLPAIAVQAGLPGKARDTESALDRADLEIPAVATPARKRPAAPAARISGIEENGAYAQIPPVLVELNKLSPRATVWVEVQAGDAGANEATVKIESRFFRRSEKLSVLDVSGIHRACRTEGTWTMKVCMSSGLGTSTLATTTFEVSPGPSVPGGLALNVEAIQP